MDSLYLINNFWVQSLKTHRLSSVKRETRKPISPHSPLPSLYGTWIAIKHENSCESIQRSWPWYRNRSGSAFVMPPPSLRICCTVPGGADTGECRNCIFCLLIQLVFKWGQRVQYSPHATSLCTQMLELIYVNLCSSLPQETLGWLYLMHVNMH